MVASSVATTVLILNIHHHNADKMMSRWVDLRGSKTNTGIKNELTFSFVSYFCIGCHVFYSWIDRDRIHVTKMWLKRVHIKLKVLKRRNSKKKNPLHIFQYFSLFIVKIQFRQPNGNQHESTSHTICTAIEHELSLLLKELRQITKQVGTLIFYYFDFIWFIASAKRSKNNGKIYRNNYYFYIKHSTTYM